MHAVEPVPIGLVSQVVPPDQLLDRALAVAHNIAEAALGTLKVIKGFITQTYAWRFEERQGDLFATMT